MTEPKGLRLASLVEEPALFWQADETIVAKAWPEFMLSGAVSSAYWGRLCEYFPDWQYVLLLDGKPCGIANSIPLPCMARDDDLPEEGWDWAIKTGVHGYEEGKKALAASALQVVIDPEHQGKGLSRYLVEALRARASQAGFSRLVVPLRPTGKSRYPLQSMAEYSLWQQADGLPFDAWLRVHVRLGARIVKPCVHSMLLEYTLEEWERMTGLSFKSAGDYIVPGALAPVSADLSRGIARYIEPNLWLCHSL